MISTVDQQPDLAARFLSLAEQLMLSLCYPGLAVLIVVEQLIPPIPSTLICPWPVSWQARGRGACRA